MRRLLLVRRGDRELPRSQAGHCAFYLSHPRAPNLIGLRSAGDHACMISSFVRAQPLALSANTDTKLLIYDLSQEGRVLAQNGVREHRGRPEACAGLHRRTVVRRCCPRGEPRTSSPTRISGCWTESTREFLEVARRVRENREHSDVTVVFESLATSAPALFVVFAVVLGG